MRAEDSLDYAGTSEVYYSNKLDRLLLVHILFNCNMLEYDGIYGFCNDFDLLGEIKLSEYEIIGEL